MMLRRKNHRTRAHGDVQDARQVPSKVQSGKKDVHTRMHGWFSQQISVSIFFSFLWAWELAIHSESDKFPPIVPHLNTYSPVSHGFVQIFIYPGAAFDDKTVCVSTSYLKFF